MIDAVLVRLTALCRRLDRTLYIGLLAAVGAVGAVVVRLARNWFHFTAFVVAGQRWVNTTAAPPKLVVNPGSGYDGQFVYRLALDPLTRSVTAHGITLDNPAYRQQRIGLPVLAHVVDVASPLGSANAIVVIEMLSIVIVALAAAVLLGRFGGNRLWALLLAFSPAMSVALARDLTEPPAWAALLVGLLCWLDRRWTLAGLAFVVAVMTRETSAAVLVGLGLWCLFRGPAAAVNDGRVRRLLSQLPALAPLAVACVAGGVWQLWLRHVWGVLPVSAGKDNVGVPVIGPLRDLVEGLWQPARGMVAAHSVAVTWEFERILTLAVLVVALLCWKRTTVPEPLRWGWATAAFLALTLGHWSYDMQFVRATHEAFDLGVLIVVTSPGPERIRCRTGLLLAVGALCAWVGVIYPLAT